MISLAASLTITAMMLAMWLVSVAKRDASVVDLLWGPGFVVVAWVTLLTSQGHTGRAVLLTTMATLWGLRLGIHLANRNLGKGEDYRYQAMRKRRGKHFWIISLPTVYVFQGAVMWVVSLPLQFGISEESRGLVALMVIGAIIFAIGLAFEAIADWQLVAFKSDPANASAVMNRGLWRYSRHPNYFGDACAWWGIGLVAASTPLGVIGLVGPLLMTYFLVRVSGVPILERSLKKSRPGYAEYVRQTSAFIPRPPSP